MGRKMKTMHKKTWLTGLLAFLLLLSACGQNATNAPQEQGQGDVAQQQKENEKKLSGDITFWTLSLSPAFDDYIHNVIAAFEAKYPGVKVNWQDIPYDQAEQKILISASGGKLADVINLNTDFLKKLAALGALVNMDEAAADVKADFYPNIWKSGGLKGTAYALPWYVSTGVLLYNTDLLKKAGLDGPPKTFDEAWAMSQVIKEKTGAYGLTVDDIHFVMLMEGVPLISDDYKTATFNGPEGVEFVKKYKKYYDDGLIPEEVLLKQVKVPEWYAQEKVAFWRAGPQHFRQIKDLAPNVYEKSDVAPAILGSTRKIHSPIMNIAVAESSKNKDVAVEFAKFITNAENQLAFSKLAPVMPTVMAAAEDEFFTQRKNATDVQEKGGYIASQQLQNAEDLILPVENVTDIYKTINEAFRKVLLENKDPQQALDEAAEIVTLLLNK